MSLRVQLASCTLLCMSLASCGTNTQKSLPDKRARPTPPGVAEPLEPRVEIPPGPYDIDTAIRIALWNSPEIEFATARLEEAKGQRQQAAVLPNGRLSAGVEAAPLSGKTTREAEYWIGWTQPVPLGGRRQSATEAADANVRARLHQYRARQHELSRRVRGAFAAALFAQSALAIERDIARQAAQVAEVARARAEAGEDPADEWDRAELEASRARVSVREMESLHAETIQDLRAVLGIRPSFVFPSPLVVTGKLEDALALPDLGAALDAVARSARLRALDATVETQDRLVELVEARRIPDIDVGFFYRRLEDSSTNSVDLQLGVNLPIFDRSEGAIRAARARAVAARARRRIAETTHGTRVRTLHRRLERLIGAVTAYREEITPRSRKVLAAAEARYAAGEIRLDQLIPIRRDHRQLELGRLELLREIALDTAEFRSLVISDDEEQAKTPGHDRQHRD